MSAPHIVAETERLILRRYRLDDAPAMLAQLNEPSFHRFIGDRGVRTVDEARAYIEARHLNSYAKNGFGMFLAQLKDGTPIGSCGLVRRDGLDDVDIGYALRPAFWGQGYALEAAKAVMAMAQGEFGLTRLVAITAQDNASSCSLLEKLGFSFERLIILPGGDEEIRLYGWGKAAA